MVRAFATQPVQRRAARPRARRGPPGAERRQHPGLAPGRARRATETARFWDVTLPGRAAGVVPLAAPARRPGDRPAPGRPPGLRGPLRRARQGGDGSDGGDAAAWPVARTGRSTPPSPRCSCCWRPRTRASARCSSACSAKAASCWPTSAVPPGHRAARRHRPRPPARRRARPRVERRQAAVVTRSSTEAWLAAGRLPRRWPTATPGRTAPDPTGSELGDAAASGPS